MNQISIYPIILKSDWFSIKTLNTVIKEQKKNKVLVKTVISKYRLECNKNGKYFSFSIDFLLGKETTLIPDIETHRQQYLQKKNKLRASSRKKNRNRGLMDSLNLDILKYRYSIFTISEAYSDYCYIKPIDLNSNTTSEKKFKIHYDEILIKKEK